MSIVEAEDYLYRCFVYIDLNMVRAGVVSDPLEWEHCGYYELITGRQRYQVLEEHEILKIFNYESLSRFKNNHQLIVQKALQENKMSREALWIETKFIGSESFQRKLLLK